MSHYVCAFRGRRDSYQIPLALAEAGVLDQFITDAYNTPAIKLASRIFPPSMQEKARFRESPGIPSEKVRCLWGTTLLEHARHRAGYARSETYRKLDRIFSLAAASRSAQTRSNLLLYNPYAWEAFTASLPHHPRRVLFQYHPLAAFERKILEKDDLTFPRSKTVQTHFMRDPKYGQLTDRRDESWKHADLILCASSFTKTSLIEAGCDAAKCIVIPYGVDIPISLDRPSPNEDEFNVLFAGSGIQRKGLHHLLLAWKRARFPMRANLTLVCRNIEPGLERMALEIPNVFLRKGVASETLFDLYSTNHLFVMPSLVEGFGQVYLEALSHGCPVLGTRNTCLPDIGNEENAVFLIETGNVEMLTSKLENLANNLPGNIDIRVSAKNGASRWSWPRFRSTVIDVLA